MRSELTAHPALARALGVAAIVGVAIAVRIVWILAVPAPPTHDSKWYLGRAKTVALHHELSVGGRPTAYRPPLYPIVLGAVFSASEPSIEVARGLNVVLGALCVFCLFVVAKQLSRSYAIAWWTAWLFALYPTDIAYTSLALSESLFNLLMLGAVASAGHKRRWSFALSAMCCCAAMLTRAQGALLVPWVGYRAAGAGPLRARTWKLAVFVALVACFAAPYWIRNARAFGGFVPIANNGGVNLYIGNNPRATGGYRFDQAVSSTLKLPDGVSMKQLGNGGPAERQIDRELSRLATVYAFEHLDKTLKLWPAKLSKLYRSDLDAFEWSVDKTVNHEPLFYVVKRVAPIYYESLWLLAMFSVAALCTRSFGTWLRLVAVAVAAVGAWLVGAPPHWIGLMLASSLLTIRLDVLRDVPWRTFAGFALGSGLLLTASHLIYFGAPRFHHPIMPWVALLAGSFVAGVCEALSASVQALLRGLQVRRHAAY